jgi:hypothetical protein
MRERLRARRVPGHLLIEVRQVTHSSPSIVLDLQSSSIRVLSFFSNLQALIPWDAPES